MRLDPNKRYLLCRPRGGFNDVMVQVEKGRLYAQKYSRVLVLDTTRSGMRLPFDDVFETQETFNCERLEWSADVADACDAATSVRPPELLHRIMSYETEWENNGDHHWDHQTGCMLNFDAAKDHPEQLLVYEQAGGGPAGLAALDKLRFKPDLAKTIIARVDALGADYVGVHIRHSDYKTDFETFLTRLRPLLAGRRVLMCSDSADALQAAQSILHPSTDVLSATDTPDLGGQPLHTTQILEATRLATDLLTDLFALAFSNRMFFTTLSKSGGNSNGAHISGFSLLAYALHKSPDTLRRLFAHADPVDVDRLLAPPPRTSNALHGLHLLNYLRWNRVAVGKAISRNRRAKRANFTPEKIGASYREPKQASISK